MPDIIGEKPKRKAMFLSPEALRHLKTTASRRRTEREAMEEALELLAARDAQLDSMQNFIDWATAVYRFDDPRAIGRRCALAKTADVVDASLAVLADQLDMSVLTTDPDDMAKLGVKFQELQAPT